ncbi:MAG: NAD-dependent epimerase/dehydratase family protein [Haliea sp.]
MNQVSRLADLKVLVTGGGGFIGRHLCRRLCDEGCEVHATSREQKNIAGGGPVWWQANMADLDTARRTIGAVKPDIIFHLAGAVGASPTLELVLPTYQSLLTSTVNVLIAATELGCRRVVLTGSFTSPVPGTIEPTPQSPYGAAKWAAAGYGRMFYSLYRTPVVILSPFMTYGPGQAVNKLIPSVTLALLRGEIPKLASGQMSFDWVYIADVIEGFVATATVPRIEGKTIELGSGSLVSVRAVIERLVDVAGSEVKPLFGALLDRPGENQLAANTAVASELLGWRATTSLDNGLRQTVEWFKAEAARGMDQEFAPD